MAAASPSRALVEEMISRPFEQWPNFIQENESEVDPGFIFAMERIARDLAEQGEGGSMTAVGLRSMAEQMREALALGPSDYTADYRAFFEALANDQDAHPGPLLQSRFHSLLEDPMFVPMVRTEAQRLRQASDEAAAQRLETLADITEGPLLLARLLECVNRDGEDAGPAVFELLDKHGASINDTVVEFAGEALAAMLDCANGLLKQQTGVSMGILGQIIQTWPRERILTQELSILLTEAALSAFSQSAFPQQWATAHNQLSVIFRERIRGDRAENLKRAIEAGEAACKIFTKTTFPKEWGLARMNTGNALVELADESRADHIERAIQAFADAAETLTERAFPKDWAKLNVNAANAWTQRVRGDLAANIEQSIECLHSALRVLTEEDDAELWATAQMNLANAFLFRVDGRGSENIKLAIQACEQALRVFKRDTFPVKWAAVRMSWANAYREQPSDDAIERALAAYNEVLEVYTKERFPEFWAKVHLNMAAAWIERTSGSPGENVEKGIASAKSALGVFTRETYATEWAKLQLTLARAYLAREAGTAADNLTLAVASATNGQQVYTLESDPARWSAAQELLGIAHARLVENNPAHHLAEAVTALTRTLEVLRPDANPNEWTRVQVALGDLYSEAASLGNSAWSISARECYGKALTVLQVRDTARCLEIALRLGEMAATADDWEEATNAYRLAAEVYERNREHALRDNEPGSVAATAALIYERVVEACLRTGRSEAAEQYAGRAESPAFIGRLVAARLESDARKLNETAQEHVSMWETTGDPAHLETAIGLLKKAVDTAPESSTDNRHHYADLGDAYLARFRRFNAPEDNDLAIEAYTQAVAAYPDEGAVEAAVLHQLGACLVQRGKRTRDAASVRRAVEILETARDLASDDPAKAAQFGANLSGALYLLYQLDGSPADLDRAVDMMQSAVNEPDLSAETRGFRCYNMASLRLTRFLRYSVPEDLDEAIRLATASADLLSAQERLRPLTTLAQALMQRSIRDGCDSDLKLAREHLDGARFALHRDSPEYPDFMHALGAVLYQDGYRTGDVPTLQQAVQALEEALATLLYGSVHVPGCWLNLGNVHRALLYHTGKGEHVDEALRCYTKAVEAAPSGPVSVQAAVNLSTGLMDAYEHLGGDLRYFQDALDQLEKARAKNPGSEETFFLVLTHSQIFARRHESVGSMDDLERAIDLAWEALRLTLHASSRRAMVCNNLAGVLKRRYDRIRNKRDIQEAIEYYRDAVKLASPAEKPGMLNGLATALASPFRHGSEFNSEVLDEALRTHREAVELTQPGSRFYAGRLHNYGNAFIDKYETSGDPEDLKNGLTQLRKAVAATPADSPTRPLFLNSLATSVRMRPNRTPADRREERRLFREACRAGLRNDVFHGFTAGQNWGSRSLEEGAWREAVIGLRYAARAMNRLLDRQLLREDKETWLRDAQHLPADWAYALARNGKLKTAVEQLEQTRTRLLAESMDSARARLDRAGQTVSHELIERYRSASDALLAVQREALSETGNTKQVRERVREIEQRLQSALEDLREEPAFVEHFSAPRFDAICSVLSRNQNEAGVYLLTTAAGTLALILHACDVKPVWIPFRSADLHDVLYGTLEWDGWMFAQLAQKDVSETLAAILPVIGSEVARPLAEALRERLAGKERPRVKLILTGTWSLLPLQAAPYGDGDNRCLLDEFVISHAPSARAVIRSREQVSPAAAESATFVGFAQTKFVSEESALVLTEPAVRLFAALFPGRSTLLNSDTSNLASEIAAALASADYLHLDCHGFFDLDKPLQSGLELGTRRLTMQQLLSEAPQCRTWLVALSACQTAVTDGARLPEEAIGLPSTFLQFGVANVLGTLWMVEEPATALLMREFYRRCRSEDLAVALRSAQLWLRSLTEAGARDELADFGLPRPKQTEKDNLLFQDPRYWAAFQITGEA